jgi:hypothetical protein
MFRNCSIGKTELCGNKTLYTVALILLLAFSGSIVFLPTVGAHTPPQTWPTFAYLAISPNPVGVGQSVYVVMWISPNPPTAMGLAGDRWRDMKLTVTTPSGDVKTVGTYDSDPTGSTYAVFTPDQIGSYKFELDYAGQVMSLVGPTGIPVNPADLVSRGGDVYVNDTFLGSSAVADLSVQQQQITPISSTPLPTSFWTRPIYGQNSAWASIASNWLAGSQIGGTGNVWQAGAGPSSAHIMWTMPIETGGIVGGNTGAYTYTISDIAYYSGGAYEGRFTKAMIIDGKLFYTDPLGHSLNGGGYTAVDLTTGEVVWHSDDIAITVGNTSTGAPNTILVPSFGQVFDYESQNQHGVVGGILWAVTGSTWSAYDSFTGKWLYNLTNVPSGTEKYADMGEIVRYILNYDAKTHTGSIALWNDTQHNVGLELVDPEGGAGTNAYQWRPNGKSVDMSNAYTWNVTFSADLSGVSAPSIVNVIPGDIILGTSTNFALLGRFSGTPDPYTMWAISDKPETRGQLLWIKNYSAPEGGVSRRIPAGNPIDTVNRVFFTQDVETFAWEGYSLDTGAQLWGPVIGNTNSFSYYGSGRGGGQVGFTAYGNLYTQGYGGEICCFNGKTGDLLWKFNNTNSGIETPWGNYPIFIAAIADGKVYAFDNEHSPNYPLYKGEKIYCIDAYSGDEVFSMLSWAGQTGGAGDSTAILADGYFVYYNYYDNSLYCVGKGPSAATVTASPKVSTQGNTILIEGTVTDVSAGAKQLVQDGKFNVVPAVSDQSQASWMEYLYMQQPKPSGVTGISVHLTATDPNGNFQDIGYVSSDSSGMFKKMWTPPVEGEYTIVASFDGSNSYYGSSAETALGVQKAASAVVVSPSPTSAVQPPASAVPTTTYVVIAATVIIAFAAVAALLFRRRS